MPDIIKLEPVPMDEAIALWGDKVQLSAGEFAKLSNQAKVKAFAVSGIAKGDQLNTVYSAMDKALKDGTTFKQFQKDCAGVFEEKGWTGKKAYRAENIYRTNIQTAYNAGLWKQHVEDADIMPFLMYSSINDKRSRPTHLALNGRVYRVDDPFWKTWYPPNGYR